MKWPKIERGQTFEDVEAKAGVVKETHDMRPEQLGNHPSDSYYSDREVMVGTHQLLRVRRQFDRIAVRYS